MCGYFIRENNNKGKCPFNCDSLSLVTSYRVSVIHRHLFLIRWFPDTVKEIRRRECRDPSLHTLSVLSLNDDLGILGKTQ